ncbi:hypothetical protein ACFL14_01270 [Patescibacteria group bacterium]
MKKFLVSLFVVLCFAAFILPQNTFAQKYQKGEHKGNKIDVSIDYDDSNGYMDYSYLDLLDPLLPIFYIGGDMHYIVDIDNLKNAAYRHIVVLITHRYYPSLELVPGSQIDNFSGLSYHNKIYIDDLGEGDSRSLYFSIPNNTLPGAGRTDIVMYRSYNEDAETIAEDNEWSAGRIFFEKTLGYFCPPEVN